MDDTERFQGRAIDGAVFQDCSMARSRFDDIDLSEASFSNVNLRGARFRDVNMTGVAIDDANIEGLTISGCDIPALIRGREARIAPTGSSAAIMAAEPQLFVSDIEAACQFYAGKLGFSIAFRHGAPAFYAQVVRGGCRLNLRRVHGPVFDGGFRSREADALSATIALDDARPLFLEFEATGVFFHQTLKTEPWGASSFIVRDPDGNLIAFAGRAKLA